MANKVDLPAHLPGLDLAATLERTGISAEVFTPILLRFAEKNSGKAAEMFAAAVHGDLQGLVVMAHTLKGASATIGASSLQESCLAVEMAVKEGMDIEAIKGLINKLTLALDVVLTSIASLRP